MRGNHFGKLFSFSSFGESHGNSMGVVIDGMPSQIKINQEDLQSELLKRAPGQIPGTSQRREPEKYEILSGVMNDLTLGSPISITIKNTNHKSEEYKGFENTTRIGHADQTTLDKYGIRDHRGSGRASGRETVSRVIAGYFAGLIIPQIKVESYITQMGELTASEKSEGSQYNWLNSNEDQKIQDYLINLQNSGESVGGTIQTVIRNVPAGLGEPCFDKLKADFSKAMLSIGTCIGFTLGTGINFTTLKGSQISTDRSLFGGIEGGISNGDDIIFTSYFKATSTVGEKAKQGRHDPCILPRAVSVVNAMSKCVLADHFLRQQSYINIKES